MSNDLTASLQTHFGFTGFRPGQADAIQSLLDGQHTLIVMPTGSGKSLIYQLTSLLQPGVTLVISPLIALMKDQVDSLARRGISATFINSTLEGSEQDKRQIGIVEGKYRLVYVAPERLRHVHFMNAIKQQKVNLLAVDEAHCISEWGHDFRPDYLHIASFRAALGDPLTAALTATATPRVQDDIVRLLGLLSARRIVTGFNRPNLAFEVRYTKDPAAKLKALHALFANQVNGGATIIYTGTRRDAEEVAEFVSTVIRRDARHYHAGLPSEDRTSIQNAFISGDLSVVVATNAFGMGIDRPDVRQVVHYSLPGSLEAYYQEAGRAGRDELPARAILLYSPDDRALQEWFIENSAISARELHLLFDSIRSASDKQRPITIEEISRLTGLQEVKVRVGLAELERAGIVDHLGDEGQRLLVHLNSWDASKIQAITLRLKQHQNYRSDQLDKMITYAESNQCRRKIILDHFGDRGPAEAEICCDNCRDRHSAQRAVPKTRKSERLVVPETRYSEQPVAPEADALSQSERVALIILDTVRRMHRGVGCEKTAQILKGSKAKDIQRFGYDKNTYYGRLAVFSQDEIKLMIDQLLEMGYLKMIGGEYPVLRLAPRGEAAIRNKVAIPINLPRQVTRLTIDNKNAERQAGGTLEYTAQLLAEGLSVEQIAEKRGLSIITIYTHAANLIAAGRVSVAAVVPVDTRQKIEAVIRQIGSVAYLAPIKACLPEEIDYCVIRCVVEGWKRDHAAESNTIAHLDITPSTPVDQSLDPVAAFLSKPHPRQLPGAWDAGWALDFHSQFTGSDWSRSGIGELAYRLKYQGDLTVLHALIEQAAALLEEHPELARVDVLTPVPPSTPREHDPLNTFAQALAKHLGLAYLPVLIKSRQTAPQKEMHTLAQKRVNVAGAFDLQSPIKGKSLLVIDDLFDSGATLEEITRVLRLAGAVKVCVLTLTRTIHSDA